MRAGQPAPFLGRGPCPAYLLLVVRYRVLISGRVQGVFFRDTCRRLAEQHGVAGWVRNLPDGRVEAVFEGPPDNVRCLVDWAHTGPRLATVANVTVRGQVLDNLSGVRSLEAQIDAGSYAPITLDANGNFAVPTAFALNGSADGAHTVRFRATASEQMRRSS